MKPLRIGALAAAASFAVLSPSLMTGAHADVPPVLTGPDSSWSTTGTTADPHTQAACAADPSAPLPVIESICPTYPITLTAPATDALHYLDVTLSFPAVAAGRGVEDYDLYVYDAAGTEVASSAHGFGSTEVASVNLIPNGDYTIKVVPFQNLPDSNYTLTARFRTAAS